VNGGIAVTVKTWGIKPKIKGKGESCRQHKVMSFKKNVKGAVRRERLWGKPYRGRCTNSNWCRGPEGA